MTGIRKRFGATTALDGVDLQVAPGEVHALIGENGAGKSTLMKVLSGAVRPDAGRMLLDGVPHAPRSPHEARLRGIAMIYQELNLAAHLTVEENVCLGVERTSAGFLRRRRMRAAVREILARLGHPDIGADVPVRRLGQGARQLVEIARALVTEARIIVMDEPTSSLGRDDAEALFALTRRLAGRGVSIVYISHFLEEVRQVADRFTVLRDGRTVGTGPVAGTSAAAMIERMVGRRLDEVFPRQRREPGEPVLELRGLRGRRMPCDADLSLRRGEVLGLFGLVGAGRTELVRAVFGLDPVRAGRIRVAVGGHCLEDAGLPPHRRIAQGIGMVSEDRKTEGLALPMSIADNITLSGLRRLSRWGRLSLSRQRAAAARWMARLEIRAPDPDRPVRHLSGGNQQKVALARLLHQDADVLLLDEPTRGIDVGAKIQTYRLMGELAAAGKAILFVSSHLPELIGVCDRIAVMSRGRVVGIRPVAQWDRPAIMAAAVAGDHP